MSDYEPVLQTRDLGPGQIASVEVRGRRIAVANVGQTYYALDGRCRNEGTDLGRSGTLRGFVLVCPADRWGYDVRTGERVEPARGRGLRRYGLKVEENTILIGPERPEGGEDGRKAG